MGLKDKISKIINGVETGEAQNGTTNDSATSESKSTIHGHVHGGHVNDSKSQESLSNNESINSKTEGSREGAVSETTGTQNKAGEDSVAEITEDRIYDVLSNVYDPEIPIDIVNLGLIYGVDINGDKVDVQMTMTSPGCPASVQITSESKYLIEELEGVSEANIEIVWDPPWTPEKMSEEAKQSLGFT